MSRAEAARAAVPRLAAAGVENPAREARLLLRWASGLGAAELSAALGAEMGAEEAARFSRGLARRAGREPLSHILGWREFWGRRFEIGPEALDPRPDTEALIGWALEGAAPRRIIDLGVGSGCILLTLLSEWPAARGLGVDASEAALALAGRNARMLGLSDRTRLERGDWLSGEVETAELIVANPPYLDAADMAALQPELLHEPALALDGGADGLDAYRAILCDLPRALAPGGAALFEIGATQADAVTALLREVGARNVTSRRDLAGKPRVLRATFDG